MYLKNKMMTKKLYGYFETDCNTDDKKTNFGYITIKETKSPTPLISYRYLLDYDKCTLKKIEIYSDINFSKKNGKIKSFE